MGVIDERYEEMFKSCEVYFERIEGLREQLYGYNLLLDVIVPYDENLFLEANSKRYIGARAFIEKIVEYYGEFTSKTGECFNVPMTLKDEECARDMLLCIISFLKMECTHEDYTFGGIKKLLKLFMENWEEEERYNRKNCIFWILYSDIEDKAKYPDEVQVAFNRLFEDFDYFYLKKIADGLLYCVRFFLYDNKMDYTSDKAMMMITIDMLDEIKERLFNIFVNRKPRKDRRLR